MPPAPHLDIHLAINSYSVLALFILTLSKIVLPLTKSHFVISMCNKSNHHFATDQMLRQSHHWQIVILSLTKWCTFCHWQISILPLTNVNSAINKRQFCHWQTSILPLTNVHSAIDKCQISHWQMSNSAIDKCPFSHWQMSIRPMTNVNSAIDKCQFGHWQMSIRPLTNVYFTIDKCMSIPRLTNVNLANDMIDKWTNIYNITRTTCLPCSLSPWSLWHLAVPTTTTLLLLPLIQLLLFHPPILIPYLDLSLR